MKTQLLSIMLVLALAGGTRANLVDSNSVVEDGIEYYLQTDKAVYNLGENVEILYRVTNQTENPVDIGMVLRGAGWCDFFVTDDDNTDIWQWMRVMPPADWEMLHLDPDEFRERQTIWDMISDNATPFDPYDDYPVGPGSYNITGKLVLDGGYERVPVSVSIEIIPEPAMIYYVDADATGAGDGTSWTDAYKFLQDALADANSAAKPVEIRVAEGIYKPDQGVGITPGSRAATFQLKNGVSLKGGYAGLGEPDPNAGDIDLYETILSGDLAGNDVDVNNPAELWDEPTRAENSYHVVTGSGTDETAVMDGFTITAGNANGSFPDNCGSGMYNESSSPTVTNCTFSENSGWFPGAPPLGYFVGGGMYNHNSNPMLTNCTFSGNSGEYGGGMGNHNSDPVLTNCTFSGNSADFTGGMYNASTSNPTLTNCILWGNAGRDGMDESAQICGETPVVNYCCIQGWTGALGGTGNINTDPLFLDATSGDYHLKSAGWRWDRQRKVWTWDDKTSPCIDAGNPGSSLENELLTIPYDPDNEFGINLRINMGAYGGTAEASMAPRGWSLLADLSNDGIVNFVDLALQVQDWLTTANEQPGNLNRDAAVNMIDFSILAGTWLKRKPFVVKITKPENGAEFYYYETIEIEAHAWYVSGSILKVEFFANGSKIGEDSHGSDGWKTNWEGDHARGSYNLTTKATNDNGATTVSLAVAIRIGGGGPP